MICINLQTLQTFSGKSREIVVLNSVRNHDDINVGYTDYLKGKILAVTLKSISIESVELRKINLRS